MADELYRSLQNVIGFLESFTDDVLPKISSHGSSTITCEANELLVGAAAGAVCFPTTIGVMELFLFAPLLLTSRITFLSSFLGMIPVSIASCTSAWTFLQATAVTKYLLEERLYSHSHRSKQGQRFRVTLSCRMEDFVFYGVIGLCAFKIFRGRFRSVLPSHLFSPGAFSCEAVMASSSNYASIVKKSKVDLIGRKYGCHSCGTRKPSSFVADHQPPNKILKEGQKQFFYPHCQSCSNRQGLALIHMHNTYLRIKTHTTTLRLYHLWLPLPLLLMTIKDYMENHNGNYGHFGNYFKRKDDNVLKFIDNLHFWRKS